MVYASLASILHRSDAVILQRQHFSQHQNLLFQLRWTLLLFSITLMVELKSIFTYLVNIKQ